MRWAALLAAFRPPPGGGLPAGAGAGAALAPVPWQSGPAFPRTPSSLKRVLSTNLRVLTLYYLVKRRFSDMGITFKTAFQQNFVWTTPPPRISGCIRVLDLESRGIDN